MHIGNCFSQSNNSLETRRSPNGCYLAISVTIVALVSLALFASPAFRQFANTYSAEEFWPIYGSIAVLTAGSLTFLLSCLLNRNQESPAPPNPQPLRTPTNAPPIPTPRSTCRPSSFPKRDAQYRTLPSHLVIPPYEGASHTSNSNRAHLIKAETPPNDQNLLEQIPVELKKIIVTRTSGSALLALSATDKKNRAYIVNLKEHRQASLQRANIKCWLTYLTYDDRNKEPYFIENGFVDAVKNAPSYHPYMLAQIEHILTHPQEIPNLSCVLLKIGFTLRGIWLVNPESISTGLTTQFSQTVSDLYETKRGTEKEKISNSYFEPCVDCISALQQLKKIDFKEFIKNPEAVKYIGRILWQDEMTFALIAAAPAKSQIKAYGAMLMTSHDQSVEGQNALIANFKLLNLKKSDDIAHLLVSLFAARNEFENALNLIHGTMERLDAFKVCRELLNNFTDKISGKQAETISKKLLELVIESSFYQLFEDEIVTLCQALALISDKQQAKEILNPFLALFLPEQQVVLLAEIDVDEAYALATQITHSEIKIRALCMLGEKLDLSRHKYQELFLKVAEDVFTAFNLRMASKDSIISLDTMQQIAKLAEKHAQLDKDRVIEFLTQQVTAFQGDDLQITIGTNFAQDFIGKSRIFRSLCEVLFILSSNKFDPQSGVAKAFESAFTSSKFDTQGAYQLSVDKLVEVAQLAELYAQIDPGQARIILLKVLRLYIDSPWFQVHGGINSQQLEHAAPLLKAALTVSQKESFDFSFFLNAFSPGGRMHLFTTF